MNINIYELEDWQSGARRMLDLELDNIREREEQMKNYMRALDVTDELCAEINNLNEQLADKQTEIDDLTAQLEQKQTEIDSLRKELLDVREQNLEAGCNQKPPEIHNHFEQGCSAQVFNDRVKGKFPTKTKTKTKTKLKNKKDKEKGKWKNLVRKML